MKYEHIVILTTTKPRGRSLEGLPGRTVRERNCQNSVNAHYSDKSNSVLNFANGFQQKGSLKAPYVRVEVLNKPTKNHTQTQQQLLP